MKTVADQTIWEVPVKGGGTRRGTERELDQTFRGKDWRSVARQVQVTRNTTYDSQIIEQDMDLQDDPRPGRLPSSARTYAPAGKPRFRIEDHSTVIPKRAHAAPTTEDVPATTPKRQKRGFFRAHPLFTLGVGMLFMLALFVAGLQVYAWWQDHQTYATYGYPRTWQCDAVVGHRDSRQTPSHFIFLNLHGHPEVIEVPGGDETKQKTYLLPQLVTDGYDTIPITGEFADVNGDGKPDLIVNIQGQNLVFLNTGQGFRPAQPGDRITLPANLQPCH
ncbi:MAG: FG-GAP repeat domain-containing protein [Ktedonobacteraceae bacterium]